MDHAQPPFRFKLSQPSCRKGETIAEAQPYAHVLSLKERGRRCDFCFSCSESLKKCTACGILHYCNVTCQRGDWALHRLECRCLQHVTPRVPSESARLMLRLLIRQQRGEDGKMLENFPGSRTFKDLFSHEQEIRQDKKREMVFAGLKQTLIATAGDILPLPPPPQLLELFGKMVINTLSICDDDLNPIGSGLYVSLSRLDHSCWPNATVVFQGTTARLQATEDIAECTPSTVFISYIDPLATRRERQEQLEQQYYFTCHCRRCEDPMQDKLLLSWKCSHQSCPGLVYLDPEGKGPECLQCHCQDFPTSFVSSVSQTLKDSQTSHAAMEKLKKEEDWASVLQRCQSCLARQRDICAQHNVYMLRTLEHAFDACVNLQLWEGALEFGEKLPEGYRNVLPGWLCCPTVALQLLKLGKLQLFQGRLDTALHTLTSALDMLTTTHGQDHPVCNTALQLLHQCQAELGSQGD